MEKERACRSPLDRANHCIALKDLMQCGDQPEREKRRPLHLEKLTNHSIPAARWRCKSTVLVVRELAFEFDSKRPSNGNSISAALQSLQTISRRIRHSDTVAASAYFPFLFLRLRKFLLWFGFNVLHMSGRMSSWTTTCEAVSTPPSAAAGCTITTPPPRSALPSSLGSASEAAAALALASNM